MLRLFRWLIVCTALLAAAPLRAQQVSLLGLHSLNHAGAFHGLRQDSAGNLYTLFEANDGVRVWKLDGSGTHVLAQAHLGRAGDAATALDVDGSGNVYVVGTSNSLGSLAGTQGTAFPNRSGTRTNAFVARLDPSLTLQWLSFCGAEPMTAAGVAVASGSVLLTGSIYQVGDAANALPVTSAGIQQSPAPASTGNGFVESFEPSTGALRYATYLTGANGDTTPAAIAADSSGNAFIVGTTTATGFPTTAALVPVFRSTGGNASGFLTKLTAAGDGFLFSTFVPGNGLTGVAVDAVANALLCSGDVATGLFPVPVAQAPIASLLPYQAAVRVALDGSSVLSATLLAPGSKSVIAAGGNGSAWIFASTQNSATVPLLPVVPVESFGNATALRVGADGRVDRATRLGGLPAADGGSASLSAVEGGLAVAADGSVTLAGGVSPTLSSSLLATVHFDLPLAASPNSALDGTVRDALPPSSCNGSACSGGAGLLARLQPDAAAPALALSTDDLPNLTLRNLGTVTATGVSITASGYTAGGNCGTQLAPAQACSISLSGSGPGSVTVQAGNAAAFTTALPATSRVPNAIVMTPREVGFGIQSAASAAGTRTLTVTNTGTSTQTFVSRNASSVPAGYFLGESASTCTPAGDGMSKVLAAGGTCTMTLSLAASSSSSEDGAVQARWQVGPGEVLVTGYAQAAALSLSAQVVDFGRQFAGGLRAPRYLFLSNGSDRPQTHSMVASTNAAFSLTDECPSTLRPQSVCRITMGYASSTAPSSDAMELSVDGLEVSVLGETLPQPTITGASANPNLVLSTNAVAFTNAAVVTTVSSETHTVTLSNSGGAAFTLSFAVSGDFAAASSCPASLPGGASCTVVVSFTPSSSGLRQGLLAVTAGSSASAYVALSGTGTAILPEGTGSLAFGDVPVRMPAVQWLRVSQSFATLRVASSNAAFTAVLVEDNGYGHGQPAAGDFAVNVSGSCFGCWLGVQFLPTATGVASGTLSLSTPGGGRSMAVSLTGQGTPLTGPILTPVAATFDTVAVHSSSASTLFLLTNGTGSSLSVSSVAVTGDFTVTDEATGTAACSGSSLAPNASCPIPVRFTPILDGVRSGTLLVTTSAGAASSTLSGVGSADPGIAFTPGELRFDKVPGGGAAQRSVTVTNTSGSTVTVGTPTVADTRFAASSACGSLAPGASCNLPVSYAASTSLADSTLTVPVTAAPAGAPATVSYVLALHGLYTSGSAGLQVVPAEHETMLFGPSATGAPALSRVLHVNNLSGRQLAVSVGAPRQFALTASSCATLAADASCDLTVQYTPLTAGDVTGTVFVTGTPTDGSDAQTGLGYLEGYGMGGGSADGTGGAALSVGGNLSPSGVVNFGQVTSGSSTAQTLTVTNPTGSAATLTLRRIRSEFPFLSTTTCGQPLAPGESCTVTVTYSPIFQAATGSGISTSQTDTGVLTLESDGNTAPQFIDLNGSARPVFVTAPDDTAPIAAFTTSQGSLFFGDVAVGSTSPAQTLTLTNTGTATVHIQQVLAPAAFHADSGCGTLVSGATCTVSVTYTPQALATNLGALEIQSDGSASLEFVSVLGSGVSPPPASTPVPTATLSPDALQFGRVLLGRSTTAVATLTNTGTVPLTVGAAAVSGEAFSLVSGSGGACSAGASLAPGASCSFTVAFTPLTAGTLRGSLSVLTSASTNAMTVALSGVGTQPQLSASPGSLDFGEVTVGSSRTLSLTLANTSSLPVDGLAFSVSSGFAVSSTCGISTLNAGSSCAVSVSYAPASAGVGSGTLSVTSSDPASPLTVALTGTGVAPTAPPPVPTTVQLVSSPAAISFGNVAVGSTGTLAITLSNPNTVAVNSLVVTPPAGFTVSSACGPALPAASSCAVIVSFSPLSAGAASGVLLVRSSASDAPLSIPLSGTGIAVQPQLSLVPSSLSFGSVSLGSSSTQSLTLVNGSTTGVTGIHITATTGFSVSGGCGSTLGAGSSCPILVSFAPAGAGVVTGTLTVASSDAASPLTAALSGSGQQSGSFLLTVDGGSSASATVKTGLPATYSLTVTPVGGYVGTVALTCAADTPVQYAACSLVPPSVTLNGGAQAAAATVSTVSAVDLASAATGRPGRGALWCLTPGLLLFLRRRRRWASLLLLALCCSLCTSGCGSGGDARIRYVAPGTYTFHVTATATSGTPASQTVSLTVVVLPK